MNQETIQLYNQDSHIKTFQGTVLTCEKNNINESSNPDQTHYIVTLDATAFFPEGGGQPSDTGTLGEVSVIDVQEKDNIIYHTLTSPLNVGETVIGEIDWEKRFDLMQHHSGEHIISGIVHKLFGYDNVGFHMGNDVITIDFNGNLTEEDLRQVETQANQAIYQNIPIEISYPSQEELKDLNYRSKKELTGIIRIVTIPRYDVCACCAPHVTLTGEIGVIKITSCQKYKSGVRISMVCGSRALLDYNLKEKNVTEISTSLSAKPYEVYEAVRHLKDENNALKGKLSNLLNQLVRYKAESIEPGTKRLCIFENDLDSIALRTYSNLLSERCDDFCTIFTGSDDSGYKYIIASRNMDVRPIGKKLNELFHGKGGGSKEMVQGSLMGIKEDIEKFINDFDLA